MNSEILAAISDLRRNIYLMSSGGDLENLKRVKRELSSLQNILAEEIDHVHTDRVMGEM